ncbi:MAG TPA: hypothetical protein VH639_06280 [Bryobacteraceae bacterium]|jgi:hypothetical protein
MRITAYIAAVLWGMALFGQQRPEGADISGVWNFATLTPLERPARFATKPSLTKEEAAAFEKEILSAVGQRLGSGAAIDEGVWLERGHRAIVNGRYLSSLVSDPPDGRIPEPTEASNARLAGRAAATARSSGPEDRTLSERCLRSASGPPMFPSADANIAEIVQSRDHVVLLVEKFHEARIVPLDSRPRAPGTPRSWIGDSRGHWEGNTLVIDTANFTDKIGLTGRFDGSLHLVERFARSSPTTLLYEVRIDDPTAFVAPWSVTVPWVRTNEPLLEFACHEGNYSLPNILRAVRDAEKSDGTGQGR